MARPDDVVVTGIGTSAYGRSLPQSVPALAIEATRAALHDAGTGVEEIDAVVPVGGHLFTDDLMTGLGVRPDALDALPAPGGNSGVASLTLADAVLRSGRASTVLVVMSRKGSAVRIGSRVTQLPGQQFRVFLERPHGWSAPVHWYAMLARRHMIEHGTTKAALAQVALTMRAHAQLNPQAVMYGRPMTEHDYRASRMVSDPYQLLDCCLETDGAVALVLTTADRAAHRPARSARVLVAAAASSRPPSPDDLTNRDDWADIGLTRSAGTCYERAGLGPSDVDVALVYDCFTFEVLHQLEEAGFCKRGESDAFVRAGTIALGGALPVNPHGGLLSEGHLMGLSHVVEAVRQLRREAGARQVDRCRVAAVTGWGDWGDGSMALLRREGR